MARIALLALGLGCTLSACGLVQEYGPARARDAGASVDARGLDAPGPDAPGLDEDAGPVDPCAGLPQATGCSEPGAARRICVDGACLPSWCGDGVVDSEAGETCEPATSPTCDPMLCRRACEANLDCVAGGPCQVGSCEGNECRYEPRADLTPCPAGVCMAGICGPTTCGNGVLDTGEQCDSPSDPRCVGCQFECDADSDCDDGDRCTRGESCVSLDEMGTIYRYCSAGVAVSCEPLSPCEVGLCDASSGGCVFLPAVDLDGDGFSGQDGCPDRDCDDLEPRVGSPQPEICNGLDDDCDGLVDEEGARPSVWCVDGDGDGFGDPATRMEICATLGPPFVRNCDDCWDSSDPLRAREAALVHPGQTSYFASPYCVARGDCRFDYDCDGAETKEAPNEERCALLNVFRCGSGAGWRAPVPDCGVEGEYARCAFRVLCAPAPVTRRQACR